MRALCVATLIAQGGCSQIGPATKPARLHIASVETLLDTWHEAASRADERAYFGAMTSGAIFMGTDATEHWTKQDFLAYAKPHFDKGNGWTFVPHSRTIQISTNGTTAWFDELLDSESYGLCRGSGVVVLIGTEHPTPKIAQYNLSFPLPNDIANDVVRQIREMHGSAPK